MFKINILFLLNTRVFSHIKHLINCQASVKYPWTTHVAKKKKKKDKNRRSRMGSEERRLLTPILAPSVGSPQGWFGFGLSSGTGTGSKRAGTITVFSQRGKKKTTAFGWRLTQCAGKNYNSFICMLKWKDIRALRRKSFITSQKWCWRNVDRHPASRVVNSSIRRAAIGWPYDVIAKSAYQLSGPGLHIPQYALY